MIRQRVSRTKQRERDPSGYEAIDIVKAAAKKAAEEARERASRESARVAGGFMGLLNYVSGGTMGVPVAASAKVRAAADSAQPAPAEHVEKSKEAAPRETGSQSEVKTNTAPTETEPSSEKKKADINLHNRNAFWKNKLYFAHDAPLGPLKSAANGNYLYAEEPHYPANFFVIAAHGGPQKLYSHSDAGWIKRDDRNDPEVREGNKVKVYAFDEIVRRIDENGGLREGQPIFLAACWAGCDEKEGVPFDDSLCQILANHYQTEVVGFTNTAVIDRDSPWGMSPEYQKTGGDGRVVREGTGRLKHFWPKKGEE